MPSLLHRPSGCEFHTRCPYAKERCRIERPLPQLRPPGQTVRCHFPLAASGGRDLVDLHVLSILDDM